MRVTATIDRPDAGSSAREHVRRCLIGLESFFAKFGDVTAQNTAIDHAITDANARVRRELHVELGTVRVVSWPEASKVEGTDYDVTEEPYDYSSSQYRAWGFLRLRRRPVQSIERVRIMLGPTNTVLTYPSEWIRLNKKPGQLSIVPTPGAGWSGMVLQNGQYFLPLLSHGMLSDNVPHVIAVDYTAGLGNALSYDEDADANYADLRHQCARLAAQELLVDFSNMVAPGIQSTSISEDGASESITYRRGNNVMFGDLIARIETDWERFKAEWRGTETGIAFTVL